MRKATADQTMDQVSARSASRLAWGLAALWLLLVLSGIAMVLASGSGFEVDDGLILTIALAFSAMGVLIASRHRRNPIGWIFLGVAVAQGLGALADGYAKYWAAGNGTSEGLGKVATWYASSSWVPWVLVPATFLLLLFPDGRLLSRRWRPVAWCGVLGIAGFFLTKLLHAGPLQGYTHVTNPFGVKGAGLDLLEGISVLLLVIGIVGSPLSLVLRFRRAATEQRQQIKWLALAGAVAAVTVVVGSVGYDQWGATAANVAIELSVLGLPAAAGIAILRYRLYNIDVVINRTLVYGALTATLALAYLASVLLLQLLLHPITQESSLAVAASTLVVAALFRPARSRIQALVDRRFYRRKYDAARTLEAFSARLREEVDLDSLSAELRAVVRETMQPAQVSLWLRERVR